MDSSEMNVAIGRSGISKEIRGDERAGRRAEATQPFGQAAVEDSRPGANDMPNGSGAAALLAAGIGCAALGIFSLLGDAFPWMAKFFTFYTPTGPLSGVTDSTIAVWLASWFILDRAWSKRDVNITAATAAAFVLLGVGFALTFPPLMDLLQGR